MTLSKKFILPIILVLLSISGLSFIFREKLTEEKSLSNQAVDLIVSKNIMKLESPAFKNNELIPAKYTCDGEGVNPPLKISEVPAEAKSLVLIVDDPDAPRDTWVHWVVWNIPPETTEIRENSIPPQAVEGITSFGEVGYGGPCPPSHSHHYQFKIYALDALLNLDIWSKKEDVEKAMKEHVLDQALLVGLYKRK